MESLAIQRELFVCLGSEEDVPLHMAVDIRLTHI